MRYKSFRIRNFKGIKDTTVQLTSAGGPSIFAFVGLNESGKTTILEAIHSFSPDKATSRLVGGNEETGVPYNKRVPRHLLSSFTGYVSVEATLEISHREKELIAAAMKRDLDLIVDPVSIPTEIVFDRQQKFERGDFKANYFTLRTELQVKNSKQKKWRSLTINTEEWKSVRDLIFSISPDISYFPTFVFDFPERIFLTGRGGAVHRFYKSVFQDILDYDGKGYKIDEDILRRLRHEDLVIPWLQFWASWNERDDRTKIQHVMDRAGATVTKVVFGRWNEIFKENTKGKEIFIVPEVLEGEKRDANGAITKTNEHDLSVKFEIRDGTRRFYVNDRSLGFRWFFAFMLFTQFRVARAQTRPLLFLFDEPAANLHAAAQQKLIDSFPEIAKGEHALAYTTHSHYMIEPRWLEQTFIVTNRADAPTESMLEEASLDDESLDINVTTYRAFVNAHPSQTSYFQPILDRLEVVPSRFDLQKSSVVVEGKSDYYILRYAIQCFKLKGLNMIPGVGAGTFGALVALSLGWGLNSLFILDGDKQGKKERERYIKEYGIPESRICLINEFAPDIKVIEDLVDHEGRKIIAGTLGIKDGALTKSQIGRFFQEQLAGSKCLDLGKSFEKKSMALLGEIETRLRQA
jgi:ABC-type branched-subunit amino acid transport system ATPase component